MQGGRLPNCCYSSKERSADARRTTIRGEMRQRITGLIAAGAVWVPSLWLILWGLPRLPLPFVLVMIVCCVAILAALKLTFLIRARIDPSFDPTFGAPRQFEWRLPSRRNR
jgi:hypothetical protein